MGGAKANPALLREQIEIGKKLALREARPEGESSECHQQNLRRHRKGVDEQIKVMKDEGSHSVAWSSGRGC